MRNARVTVLAVGVGLTLFALAGCGSDSTHGSEGTLRLTEPGGESGSFGAIGHPTRGKLSPGNGFAFSTPLQDSAKKTVGEVNAICIATQPSSPDAIKGTCSGTATVPGGSFALNVGGKSIGNSVSGAIVGGTGKYAGATGTFSSKPTGGENGSNSDTFSYTLP
jgi:hypothetical protein